MPTIFRSEGVRQRLEQPPFTRHNGWNLITVDRARIVNGERLSVSNGTRKHIDLFEDGTLIAFGTFDNFLFSRHTNGSDDEPKANSLAVIEFVHDFVLVYSDILVYVVPLPPQVRLTIGLRNATYADGMGLYLPPYGSEHIQNQYPHAIEPVEAATWDWSFDMDVEQEPPHLPVGAAAFRLIERLYVFFNRTVEEIPYTNAERDAIDVTRFPAPRWVPS